MFSRIITLNKSILSLAESKRLVSSRSVRAAWLTAKFTAVISVLAWVPGVHRIAVVTASQSSPVASVDQATYDFGEVYEGEHIFHTFRVRNTGSLPLEIHDPAAKAENSANDRNTQVAVDFESGHGIPGLAGQAAFSDHSFGGQTQARAALHPSLAARGRPAAPA